MNIEQLQQILDTNRVRSDAYCLTGGLPNEAYTIEHEGTDWRVYYSERGERSGLMIHDSEFAACEDLLQRILGDLSTRL